MKLCLGILITVVIFMQFGPHKANATLLSQVQHALYEFTGYGGTGSSGALTVNGIPNGPTNPIYTDSVKTYLTAAAAVGATTITVATTTGFNVGDEIVVIQMLGTGAGKYETRTITSKTATTLTYTGGLSNAYPTYAAGSTVTQVVRIPHYTTVTLNSGGFLTVSPFNGQTGGVMFIRSNGGIDLNYNATMSGTISVKGKGYAGGAAGGVGSGPGGGPVAIGGTNRTPGSTNHAMMGAGGGGSATSGAGGAGGGIMIIKTSGTIMLDGDIDASGAAATGTNAGGGAGGTLIIFANSISRTTTCGLTSVDGGAGNGTGTAGGSGRAFINYATTLNCTNATPTGGRSYRKFKVR